jgi:hypothetical protein
MIHNVCDQYSFSVSDGGDTFLLKVGNHLHDHILSQSRGLQRTSSPFSEHPNSGVLINFLILLDIIHNLSLLSEKTSIDDLHLFYTFRERC